MKMYVLIDNGHGEETPGKRSPDGRLRECRYARRVAVEVVKQLKENGIEAMLLVPETADVPLAERVRRVNACCNRYGRSNVLLVSIHCNASGDGSAWMPARGWSAYTSTGQTQADVLANYLYKAAEHYFKGQKIRCDRSDGDPDFEAGFYILRHTKCPAVLTENFFQDNRDDVAYLLSEEGFRAVAGAHVAGITGYLRH